MDKGLTLGERFLLAYLRVDRLGDFGAAVDLEFGNEVPPSFASHVSSITSLRQSTASELVERCKSLGATDHPEIRTTFLTCNLLPAANTMGLEDLALVSHHIATSELPMQPDISLLRFVEAFIAEREGRVEEALDLLDANLGSLVAHRARPAGDFARHLAYLRKGEIYARLGDYSQANGCLEKALALCNRWGYALPQLDCKARLAELLWMSGQNEQGLFLHQDKAARDTATRAGQHRWLLHSHLSAAKCAIDAKKTDVAIRELAQAETLLAAHSEGTADLRGYWILYSGQVALQEALVELAIRKFNEAERHFESLEPPLYRGAMEAKISLAEFALYERNYALFVRILEVLLDQAEKHGCIEARSRLLLLSAYLFITEDPPLRESFDRTMERIHLINNPALLLRALSFLYNYALQYLDEREQAFLLSRIRRLEPLLEKSCFEGLYKTLVADLYQGAIENRLSRLIATEEGTLSSDPA